MKKYIVLTYVNSNSLLYPFVSTITNLHAAFLDVQEKVKKKVSLEYGNGYSFKYLIFDLNETECINSLLKQLIFDLETNSSLPVESRYLREFELGQGRKIFKALEDRIKVPKALIETELTGKTPGTLKRYLELVKLTLNRDTGKYL